MTIVIVPLPPGGLQVVLLPHIVVAMPRDYVREMDALFAKIIDDRPSYVLRDVAAEARQWCQDNDPDLLLGWLGMQAEDLLWQSLTRREAGQRARASTANKHAVFQAALDSASGPDKAAARDYLSMLDTRFACNINQERKKYGQMTKEEVMFVASTYARLENRSRLKRLFHEAVAGGLGEGEIVGDKFDPGCLLAIQQELGIPD